MATAHALLNSCCTFIYNQVIMQNVTAVKLLVCYIIIRLAFTVLWLATGAPRCKSDTSDRLKKLMLLKLGVFNNFNPLNAELNPICYLLALLAHHFLHVSRIRVKSLTFRLLMSYIYINMERLFLMFLDHTQRRSTVGRTPLDE